jgi:hypothetical protein
MTLVHWLRRRPLHGYFTVACGISWGGILIVLGFTGFNLTKLRALDTGLIRIRQGSLARLHYYQGPSLDPGAGRRHAVKRLDFLRSTQQRGAQI